MQGKFHSLSGSKLITMSSHERALKDDANNVTYQRCHFAYEYMLDKVENKSLLDVGCGLAYGTALMAQKAKEVTGLDYDKQTIEQNKLSYPHQKNLSFKQGAVPPLPFEKNSFDIITAFQFIEHIHERSAFIQNAVEVLKPGGMMVITTPNEKMSLARNPFHVHEYTFAEMQQTLEQIPGIRFELLGLNANKKVKDYYEKNGRFVRAILKWDVLGLHKKLPSHLLTAPYNFVTSVMRNRLKKQVQESTGITTADFSLQNTQLDQLYDIYAIIHKQ